MGKISSHVNTGTVPVVPEPEPWPEDYEEVRLKQDPQVANDHKVGASFGGVTLRGGVAYATDQTLTDTESKIKLGDQGDELTNWWMNSALEEIEPMIEKIVEYGGNGRAQDLVDVGRRMFDAGVKLPGTQVIDYRDAEDSQFIELTIYFYVIGKIGRWTAAINEGNPVSDDTLKDIVIYTKMLQRVREVGGWPV